MSHERFLIHRFLLKAIFTSHLRRPSCFHLSWIRLRLFCYRRLFLRICRDLFHDLIWIFRRSLLRHRNHHRLRRRYIHHHCNRLRHLVYLFQIPGLTEVRRLFWEHRWFLENHFLEVCCHHLAFQLTLSFVIRLLPMVCRTFQLHSTCLWPA